MEIYYRNDEGAEIGLRYRSWISANCFRRVKTLQRQSHVRGTGRTTLSARSGKTWQVVRAIVSFESGVVFIEQFRHFFVSSPAREGRLFRFLSSFLRFRLFSDLESPRCLLNRRLDRYIARLQNKITFV
jgi:hypothetical protein